MVPITRGTLDSTLPNKSTRGDNIFKGQNVITGVCSCELPWYTGRLRTAVIYEYDGTSAVLLTAVWS